MTNKELEAKVAELEAENKKLKETAEAAPAPEADVPMMGRMVPYVETETKTIRLFRDEYRYKEPLYVAINGRNWVIKRGVEVTLPKYVADYIETIMAEEEAIRDRIDREEREYREMTARQV